MKLTFRNCDADNLCYSMQALDNVISKESKFSLAIIDGPATWKPEIRLSRYLAIPYLNNFLSEEFSLYLDDINRKGEKEIISLWDQKYKIKFEQINATSAVCTKGNKLNIIL